MSYLIIDDPLPRRTMNPRKGDIVRTTVEGEYSHKGDPALATGFHIVKVGNRDVALPPETEFQVVKPWRPPEPPPGSIVHNTRTGNFWQRDRRDLLGRFWGCINDEGIELDCRQGHGPECDADCWGAFGCPRRHRHGAEPAPEPAGDGPGWDREWLQFLPYQLQSATYEEPDLHRRAKRELAALIAERDQLRQALTYEYAAHQRERLRWKDLLRVTDNGESLVIYHQTEVP